MDKNKTVKGVLAALTGGSLWGVSGCFGQYLFTYKGVTSSWLVPWRLFFSGLLILLLLGARKEPVFRVWKRRRDRIDIVLFAVFGMAVSQYGYFSAVQYSNAGTATVLQYLGQIMILIYVCVTTPRFPKGKEYLAMVLSLAGVFLLATHGKVGELVLRPEALFFGILAAIGFVAYAIQPARIIEKFSVLTVMGWGMLVGGLILLVLMHPWTLQVNADKTVILFLVGIILLGTIIAYYLILSAIRMIGPVMTSLLSCMEPVVATVLAAFWLGTSFSAMDIAGALLILISVVVITR